MATLLLGSVALIVMATTMPWSWYFVGHAHWANVEWIPFSRRIRPDDFILNVLLFTPFGFTAVRALAPDDGPGPVGARRSRAMVAGVVLAGACLSMSVELFQVYCHGRMPTTVDVISNTLGTWLGTRAFRS